MEFPKMDTAALLKRLESPKGKVRMVLDTDTYNEVDDQFALVYALSSSERLQVEAVYAAPFHNKRSCNAGDGMEKSYQEIVRLMGIMGIRTEGFVFRGSSSYLTAPDCPVESEAVDDLIHRVMESPEDDPLYVVAIGAITNIASAIIKKPEIINKMVVVWLGGHPLHWKHTREFNLRQDIGSSRVLFDSGVPMIQIPCAGVASHLLTTVPELETYLYGKNNICDALVDLFKGYETNHFGWAKEIWDISAIAYLVNPNWVPTQIVHSPILTDQCTWSHDAERHFIRTAVTINRNEIFRDMFRKLSSWKFEGSSSF